MTDHQNSGIRASSGPRARAGFALPLALMIIVVLTAAIAAGLAASAGELGTAKAERGAVRAYNIAESGLEQYVVSRDTLCKTRSAGETCIADLSADVTSLAAGVARADSFRIPMSGGYAEIVAHQIRADLGDTLPALYFVRSRGVDTVNRISGRDSVRSQRTVGLVVAYNTNVMNVLSAWTSLSGIQKNGTAGTVSGVDQCGQKASVAGIAVPSGDFIKSGNWTAQGNPPADSTSTLTQLEARTKIDWNAIINNNAMPADIEIPPQSFPTSAQFQADTNWWPVIRIHTNNYSLPNAGRGIIIADGDFTISGSNMWNGIVLVGGKLTSNGNNTTSGATVSGLNLLLPNAPQPGKGYVNDDASLNGQKNYQYNSCYIAMAATRLKKFTAMPNTWVDDVPAW